MQQQFLVKLTLRNNQQH